MGDVSTEAAGAATVGVGVARVVAWTLCALVQVGAMAGDAAPGVASRLTSGLTLAAMDASVRPQDDLYRRANGTWLRQASIAPDKAYAGPQQAMADVTQEQLRAILEQTDGERDDPGAARLADLYASFMDEAEVQRRGVRPLAEPLEAVQAVADRSALAAEFRRLDRAGLDAPLNLSIDPDPRDSTRYAVSVLQSGLGLPNRDYYLDLHDERFAVARDGYVLYLASLLRLADPRVGPAALEQARSVLALETQLAQVQWSEVRNRDPLQTYHQVALADLPALAPSLDWDAILDSAQLSGKTTYVLVHQPSYVTSLAALVAGADLGTWKTYLRVRWLGAFAPYLGAEFVQADHAFVGSVLNGTEHIAPRWERGVTLVNGLVGQALGRRYVERHFPAQSKQRIDALVAQLLTACRLGIEASDWMGPATKARALSKLALVHTKVGYPQRWIDYSALQIRRDDLVGNVLRARYFEDDRQRAKLGQPVDRQEWAMTPQTVNAYYDASFNEIVFPAAYLQAPMFDPAADDAANYGAVGSVIGHEISHAFDDEGSLYDGHGNLSQWWTPQDRRRFELRTRALVEQYAAFQALPGYHVDGELTLGENIADNAGLAIAYRAYRLSLGGRRAPVIDGLSGDERFFYAYAQSWRSKIRDEALLTQIKSDPHAPDEFRVTGPVRNLPAFYTTFGVRAGDAMFLPAHKRVLLW